MSIEVAVYQVPGHVRSQVVSQAMFAGIKAVGDRPVLLSAFNYQRPNHQAAVFYGMAGNLAKALTDYPAAGRKAVYIDLGYWGRKPTGNRWAGFHKLSVNGRHPTAYFQARAHDGDRAACHGLVAAPWRDGGPILLCGMGPKGARAEGYATNEWEGRAVAQIRAASRRPILYRPKPNWPQFRPIPGTDLVSGDEELCAQIERLRVHAVVSHHSNANVEALILGVPSFTLAGIATAQGSCDLSAIDAPIRRDDRQQWLADAAYTQFSIAEMTAGVAWRHLKDEGLVP